MSYPFLSRAVISSLVALFSVSVLHAQEPNPFLPPKAKVWYAPDRDFDLKHISVTLTIDPKAHSFQGSARNDVVPLRGVLNIVTLNCGANLTVRECSVDGKAASFQHKDGFLKITPVTPIAAGTLAKVRVVYTGGDLQGDSFGSGGGWHWIDPSPTTPNRAGFWTQGETGYNSNWVPTWDYPNDFATSESIVTVPETWEVIGNGVLLAEMVSKTSHTKTFHWKMSQPHATYLLSLVAGALTIKRDKWRDVPLLYVVPKGEEALIEDSFSDTPDMLEFFSQTFGVKYAWPKYAQNAMFDFGGGMENVSATTLGEGSLTDARDGFRNMSSLNSHELGHQWFGDLVTCRDWGHIWLNESFATFAQMLYAEHSEGKDGYAREVEDAMQSYFGEARRYKRPLATNLYPEPDSMFDSHTYPKGGSILHTLRRQLGDKVFFKGIQLYLTRRRHQPSESQDLCIAISDSSGVNVQSFFNQWVYKPGHPVLDTTWAYDEAKHEVKVSVKQTQDTSDGTPIYTIPVKVGLISGGKMSRLPALLTEKEQSFTFPATAKPDAVVFDPDHDFLREIPTRHWSESELPYILRYAPDRTDRIEALRLLLKDKPSDETIKLCAEVLKADSGKFAALGTGVFLSDLRREDLRAFWREQAKHPYMPRHIEAIRALGLLTRTDEDVKLLRAEINDKAPYDAIINALKGLREWDAPANKDIFLKATTLSSRNEKVLVAALKALHKADPTEGVRQMLTLSGKGNPLQRRAVALAAMGEVKPDDAPTKAALKDAVATGDPFLVAPAAEAIKARKDKDFIPALKAFAAKPPRSATGWAKGQIQSALDELEK